MDKLFGKTERQSQMDCSDCGPPSGTENCSTPPACIEELLKGWKEEIPKGCVPTFYTTLTYDGDIKIQNQLKKFFGWR